MAVVWIPSLLRDVTRGQETVQVSGRTVREVVANLEQLYPGIQARLCEGDGLRPGLAVAVDSLHARLGMLQPVAEDSEVHFLPALAGGAPA
jgi:sulfur-carrier protein